MKIDLTIHREVAIALTPRVQQMLGIFDLPPAQRSLSSWQHHFTLPEKWNIGVIVGPSGSGKTTLAREAFGISPSPSWPENKSILDGFSPNLGIRDIAALLCSVGFSSPPAWLRPFHALSNGQQFRVNLARVLAESTGIAVVDEFSSVVDRTAAQIGSAAVAKVVRRRDQKFVAITCHYDILDWLEPDWVYEPHLQRLTLNELFIKRKERVVHAEPTLPFPPFAIRVFRRPKIELLIRRVHRDAWKIFKPHHYLSGQLHRSATCFVGLIDDRPAVFTAVLFFPHPSQSSWREHRTVCLPDFQGVGIGNAMSEYIASLFAADRPYTSTTSHPAMIRHRMRSNLWRVLRKPSMVAGPHRGLGSGRKSSAARITAGFRYVGPPRPLDAQRFGLRASSCSMTHA